MNSLTRRHSSFERSDWGGNIESLLNLFVRRHARACAGHPCLGRCASKAWMAESSPAMTGGSGRNQTVELGEQPEMIVGISERGIDRGHPLEVVADLVFHGHADAAVQLDRLLAD